MKPLIKTYPVTGLRCASCALNVEKTLKRQPGVVNASVNQSTLSRANEKRDWRIFADFGEYLIKTVRPLYANTPIPNIDIKNEIFAIDSTTISLSINLFKWAEGKYTRSTSSFDKTPVKELLTEIQVNQNIKEQYDLFNS